jgi:hypothetical protein
VTPCNQAVRDRLESGADTTGALGQNMQAWSMHGRLNVAGALQAGGGEPPVPPPPPEPQPPAEPISFEAVAGESDIVLSWASGGGDISGYDIERDSLHPKNGRVTVTEAFMAGAADTDYVDLAVEAGQRYVYRLRARNLAQVSEWVTIVESYVELSSSGGGGGDTGGGGKGGGKPKK